MMRLLATAALCSLSFLFGLPCALLLAGAALLKACPPGARPFDAYEERA